MSEITRHGKNHRPSWNYLTIGSGNIPLETLEMLESVRNVLEQVRDELRAIRSCGTVNQALRDIGQIRRNTTKPRRKKAVKP